MSQKRDCMRQNFIDAEVANEASLSSSRNMKSSGRKRVVQLIYLRRERDGESEISFMALRRSRSCALNSIILAAENLCFPRDVDERYMRDYAHWTKRLAQAAVPHFNLAPGMHHAEWQLFINHNDFKAKTHTPEKSPKFKASELCTAINYLGGGRGLEFYQFDWQKVKVVQGGLVRQFILIINK